MSKKENICLELYNNKNFMKFSYVRKNNTYYLINNVRIMLQVLLYVWEKKKIASTLGVNYGPTYK